MTADNHTKPNETSDAISDSVRQSNLRYFTRITLYMYNVSFSSFLFFVLFYTEGVLTYRLGEVTNKKNT